MSFYLRFHVISYTELGILFTGVFFVVAVDMSTKYIISALAGSFAVAWLCDYYFADKKIFGGKL